MIDMDLLSVIRRWHFRQGTSIREIRRRTGPSRNTICKYLRSDTVEPSFKVPLRASKPDPFADKLTAWLRVESKKSGQPLVIHSCATHRIREILMRTVG